MKADTVSILRSPVLHEPLRLVSRPGCDAELHGWLESRPSGKRYPLREGIPLLMDEAALSGPNLQYQAFYDKVAGLYDPAIRLLARIAGAGERKYRWEFLQELGVQPGMRVLEVFMGTGANIRHLPTGAAYVGVDISWGMLHRCQKNMRKWGCEAELIQGNAEEPPLVDETFDAVLHVGGINAFNDRGRAIGEMIRAARGGARIVIVDENAGYRMRD